MWPCELPWTHQLKEWRSLRTVQEKLGFRRLQRTWWAEDSPVSTLSFFGTHGKSLHEWGTVGQFSKILIKMHPTQSSACGGKSGPTPFNSRWNSFVFFCSLVRLETFWRDCKHPGTHCSPVTGCVWELSVLHLLLCFHPHPFLQGPLGKYLMGEIIQPPVTLLSL